MREVLVEARACARDRFGATQAIHLLGDPDLEVFDGAMSYPRMTRANTWLSTSTGIRK